MKTPWLPKKPNNKINKTCKSCKGSGQSFYITRIWAIINCACDKCGGKGFI